MRNINYRMLASAVINQAVKDTERRVWSQPWATRDALEFLGTDNPHLRMWCDIANIDSMTIVREYRPRYEAALAEAA